jgi:dTDP-4-dehydrorhamnose 3,5-epimerase
MTARVSLPAGMKLVKGDSPIVGVNLLPLRVIPDERGAVMHMMRRTDPHFTEFGEIYFSTIYKDVIKGWHKHVGKTLNYACVHGRVKVVLFDGREGSASKGSLMECFIGPENYGLLVIPPNVWNGFKGMTDVAIVANCTTEPFDEARSSRMDPFDPSIPYDWALKHG